MSVKDRIARLERAGGASAGALAAYEAAAARNWARGSTHESMYQILVPEAERARLSTGDLAGWEAQSKADRERRAELLRGDTPERAAADFQTEHRWLDENRATLTSEQRGRLADFDAGRLHLEGMRLRRQPSPEMLRALGYDVATLSP